MAPPISHRSRLSSTQARSSSLLYPTLLLCCWLLTTQGAESPARTTPLSRRQREAGCAQSCAQVSEMSRCLRMACRKYAMGPLIRFGKRDRNSRASDIALGVADLDLSLSPAAALSLSQREDILEKLLSHDRSHGAGGSRSRDPSEEDGVDEQLDLSVDSDEENMMTSRRPHWAGLDPEWLLSPEISRLSSRHPVLGALSSARPRDSNSRLLRWLLQASRDLDHVTGVDDNNMLSPYPDSSDNSAPNTPQHASSLERAGELRMPSSSIWDNEASQKQRVAPLGDNLSPLTLQDLSSILGKQVSSRSTSATKDRAHLPALPSENFRRHQRGLLKHLIRFG